MAKQKKWELLRYAYDNYPKGIRFEQMSSKETIESSGCFYLGDYGTHFAIYDVVESSFVFNSKTEKWATIITEPERKALLVSEDGFNLYEGDEYWDVNNGILKKGWNLSNEMKSDQSPYMLFNTSAPVTSPDKHRAFKHKENALKWVEEANKPKEIEIEFSNGSVILTKDRIIINGTVCLISKYQLEDFIGIMEGLK